MLQKFVFGKPCARGVGWVAKQYAALGTGQRGWGQPPPWLPWGRTHKLGGLWSRSLTFLLMQDSNSKTSSGALGSDPWTRTMPIGQAEVIYKLSFPLLSLFMLVCLLGFGLWFVFFFFLILTSFPVPNWYKLPHVWKRTVASARLGISQSHLPLSVFMYFFRCTVCPVVSQSLEVSHLQPSCLTHFRGSITKTLRPGKNRGRKDTLG